MPFNHAGARSRAARMIKRWGAPAQLLRNGQLRDCVSGTLDYNPRANALTEEELERIAIAAPLAIPPDHEKDVLIRGGKKYAFVTPVKGPRPGGVDIFYDCMIAYRSTYP